MSAPNLEVQTATNLYIEAWREGWIPDPTLTVSQWADEHRILSGEAAAEPGPWRTSRTPYLREIMDCLSPSHPCEDVVFQKGAQVGGTECGNNWIGYIVHKAPGPLLMVEPTVDVAKRVSRQRLAPMIRETPALRARIRDARSRDSGNTTLVKEFQGGMMILTGANSAAGLRSMPIRYLFCDEIDEYPEDVDGQGDPMMLAEKRTSNFSRRKRFKVSTPTIKMLSRVEREMAHSDYRRFFVPCPHCSNMDWLRWENIQFTDHNPETARLLCIACKQLIEERHKTWMMDHGEWRSTAVGDGKTVGFHLSSLYSPLGWKSWPACVDEFLKAKENTELLKTWVNTVLGETWEEQGDVIAATGLAARREVYPAEVPAGVAVLIGAVDVQINRLECQIMGFGTDEEAWLIEHEVFWGDPGQGADAATGIDVWAQADEFLLRPRKHESGAEITPAIAFVDSGAHTDSVYDFVEPRQHARRRVFAVKGVEYLSKPGLVSEGSTKRARIRLFTIATFAVKDRLFSRLKIRQPGPGFIHLPEQPAVDDSGKRNQGCTEEYLEQLVGEKKITIRNKRTRTRKMLYVKTYHRNEALDLTVYCFAGLFCLQTIIDPVTFRDLKFLQAAIARLKDVPPSLRPIRRRKFRSRGVIP